METTQGAEVAQTNQQTELSIEDRILGAMGEEILPEFPEETKEEAPEETPEETPEEAPEEPTDDYVELELDGELYQVPKKLQEGYLRQQDYTRKTQEVAQEKASILEQRQAVEAERQAFQNQVALQSETFKAYAQISAIDNQIAQYSNIDWQQLVDTDPVEAMKLDRGLRDLKESRNNLVQETIAQQQQLQQYQAYQYQQALEQGQQELVKRIPDWSAEKAKSLRDFGQTFGFTAEELNITDARIVDVLHKAYLYDQLKNSAPEVNKKVSVAPKIVKSGAQQQKQSNTDVLRKIVKTSTDKATKQNALQRLLEAKLS